ncbi:MAG TPA: ferritin [Verrucomicrobiota bacterium]|jgi:ferritin|nr:ferritin [Verrucomicrobiota bacterium]HQL79574.1 ferritin [Verrucomicrobiota bacterium]
MKLSKKMEKVINDQINLELSSAYAYLAMAAYFESTPFTGFAKWMRVQSAEELDHANRFFKYLVQRGGRVVLQSIPAPNCDYKSPLEAFKTALGHEQKVSASICAIYELAGAEKDYPTTSFLKWFLDEQVEEEQNVTELLAKLEVAGDHRIAILHLDRHAGKRSEEEEKD